MGFLEQSLLGPKGSGHNLISLDEAFLAAIEGRAIDNAVVFTIDDGFFNNAIVDEHIFVKHGVPVTIFLATDFIGGKLWMIGLRLAYLVEKADLIDFTLSIETEIFEAKSKRDLVRKLTRYAKTLTLPSAESFVAAVSDKVNVIVPGQPSAKYRPLTWDDARHLEELGVSFGAHATRYPIHAVESGAMVRQQISMSIERLKQELHTPS